MRRAPRCCRELRAPRACVHRVAERCVGHRDGAWPVRTVRRVRAQDGHEIDAVEAERVEVGDGARRVRELLLNKERDLAEVIVDREHVDHVARASSPRQLPRNEAAHTRLGDAREQQGRAAAVPTGCARAAGMQQGCARGAAR
jgi:hypothetical protein